MLKLQAESNVPTQFGEFRMMAFSEDDKNWMPHMALIAKDTDLEKPTNVRIHSECITGEVFHSKKCECGEQLDSAMKYMQENGGIILYLRQEGRRINTRTNRAVNCLFLIVELLSQLFPIIFACSVLSQTYRAPGNHVIVRYIHKKDGKKNNETI